MDTHRRRALEDEHNDTRRHRHHRQSQKQKPRSPSPWLRRRRLSDRPEEPAHPPMPALPPLLPFGARPLCRADYAACQPVFAYYLALQKSLCLADLPEAEALHRWAVFVGRWNRRALPLGWYRPQMSLRVVRAQAGRCLPCPEGASDPYGGPDGTLLHSDSEDDDDDVEPAPPGFYCAYENDPYDHDDDDYARLGAPRNDRAEHYARLEELLPRTTDRRAGMAAGEPPTLPHGADEGDYRRMLATLQRRRQGDPMALQT